MKRGRQRKRLINCFGFGSSEHGRLGIGAPDEARQYAEGLWQSLRSRGICGVRSFYERWAGNDGAERRATPVMVEAPFEVNLPEAGNCVSLSGIWDRVELGTSDGGTAKSGPRSEVGLQLTRAAPGYLAAS